MAGRRWLSKTIFLSNAESSDKSGSYKVGLKSSNRIESFVKFVLESNLNDLLEIFSTILLTFEYFCLDIVIERGIDPILYLKLILS